MSYKMSRAYYPTIIKFYDSVEHLITENGFQEYFSLMIDLLEKYPPIRYEISLSETSTHIISTAEFATINDMLIISEENQKINYNDGNGRTDKPLISELTTHLF